MKQTTFASAAWEKKGKVTRRERFLGEMDQVIPWGPMSFGTVKNGGVANTMAARPDGCPPPGTSAENVPAVHR